MCAYHFPLVSEDLLTLYMPRSIITNLSNENINSFATVLVPPFFLIILDSSRDVLRNWSL